MLGLASATSDDALGQNHLNKEVFVWDQMLVLLGSKSAEHRISALGKSSHRRGWLGITQQPNRRPNAPLTLSMAHAQIDRSSRTIKLQ
jgi:hypothetical protein